jgi:hypothetical protein
VTKTPSERFFAKVDKSGIEGACWIWTGALVKGYGQFYAGPNAPRRLIGAHRWSYEHHVGPIPEGLQLDHRCHSVDRICVGGVACTHRACVNPAHLEPVTAKTNIERVVPMARARRGLHHTNKDRCPRDHEYSAENTYVRIRPGGGINRVCRTCKRIRWAADAAKKPKAERQVRTGFVSASRKAWPEDLDRARTLMGDGVSLREAARQIGLSHTQLRRRLLGIR